MKKITITLPDELAHRAKIFAAEHNTSVSRYVGELLSSKMESDKGYRKSMQQWQRRPLKALQNSSDTYPKRDHLYDR